MFIEYSKRSKKEQKKADNLACLAKYVTKLHGVCVDCGNDGYISYKTDGTNTDIVDVGSVGKYICLCEKCASRRDAYEK